MAIVGWLDTVEVVEDWSDAPQEATLKRLLGVAHEQLVSYAPKPLVDPVPASYELAQLLLTQHLWARKRAGDGDTYGPDGFQFSTYPLVMEARGLIRPRTSPLDGLL